MDVVSTPRRFEVHLVTLDPALGAEIRKTRPCVVVSPDLMNRKLMTVIVAPMTTRIRRYPNRVKLIFDGKDAEVALDELRSVDRSRLVRRLGPLDSIAAQSIAERLVRMFTL